MYVDVYQDVYKAGNCITDRAMTVRSAAAKVTTDLRLMNT